MRAVYYEEHGPATVLKAGELPVPEPGENQVLVQVCATSVNPIDRRLRAGELTEYIQRTFPVVPGWDLAGRIVKVGAGVSDWAIGDEVLGLAFTWAIQHGSYAEFCPIDVTAIARKPAGLRFTEAAALPLVSLTAWQALHEFGELAAGQTALIQAAAGGVGSVAVPMARHLGAKVYATASAANADYVSERGADIVIDYREHDYRDVVRQHEPDGVDLVYESLLGEGIAEDAIRLAKSGGVVVFMNNEPPDMPEINARQIKTEFLHHRPDGAMLSELATYFADGVLPLPAIEVIQLGDAIEAQQRSEAGHTRGKLVIEIAP